MINEVVHWESDEAEEISLAAAAAHALENYCPSDDNRADISEFPDYECNYCDKQFTRYKRLRQHVKKVHPEKLVCQVCNQKMTSEETLERHQSIHINECTEDIQLRLEGKFPKRKKRESCHICNEEYPTSQLKAHVMLDHGLDHPFKCSRCEKDFVDKHQMEVHIRRIHEQKYTFICAMCGKGFACLQALQDHERVHRGERPFACDMCDKTFYSMSHLKSHTTTHKISMEVECDICHKKYANVLAMKEHKKQHSDEYRNRFKCTICDKGFFKKQQLNRHVLSHSSIKPYKCDHCGIAYKSKDLLEKHKNKHTETKSQVCEICGKAYFMKKNLTRHMIAAHKEIHELLYRCDICNHVLSTERSLIDHKRKKHDNNRTQEEIELENTIAGMADEFFLAVPFLLDTV